MADVEAEEEAPLEQQPGEDRAAAEAEDDEEPEGEEEEQESLSSEEDLFELLDESEPDDEEEQAMYKDYLEVIKEIDAQNLAIHDLKAMATELRCKRCMTYKDRAEYKRLRICQEKHDIYLRTLINRAARLQNFGSRRLYGELEIELADAEENCYFTGLASTSFTACPSFKDMDEEKCCNKGCLCCWESDSDSDSENCDPACWAEF